MSGHDHHDHHDHQGEPGLERLAAVLHRVAARLAAAHRDHTDPGSGDPVDRGHIDAEEHTR